MPRACRRLQAPANLTTLEDDGNDDDLSGKPGILSAQAVLFSSLYNEEQLREEQSEVFWEEDHFCGPGCELAEGEPVCGAEPAEALGSSLLFPGWPPGTSPGRGSCTSSYSGPYCSKGDLGTVAGVRGA